MHNSASAPDRRQTAGCRLVPLAAVLGTLLMEPGMARADDWGCQVMLCLSNPGGPEQYAECVPPIERLWAALRHGDPFPTCDVGAGGSQGGTATNTLASGGDCREDLMDWRDPQPSDLRCRASGADNVVIDNQRYARVWWGVGAQGPTITESHGVGSTQVPYCPVQSATHVLQRINQQWDRFGGGY